MKRKMSNFIIFSLLLLLFGCTGEVVTNLPEEEVPTSESPLEIQGVGMDLTIKFKPQPYAKEYYYQFSGEEENPINNLDLEDGKYSFIVSVPENKTVGKISVFAENNSGTRTLIGIGDYAANLSDTTPNACLSRRLENSAEIAITPISNDIPVLYRVKINDKEPIETIYPIITIEELDSNETIDVEVSQRLIEDTSWSNPVKVIIPAYEKDKYDSNMTIKIGTETIDVFDIPDGITDVHLGILKNGDGGGQKLNQTATVVNHEAQFEIKDLKSLESGEFFVYYGEDCSKSNSNHINYTSPLMIKNQTNYWQSVELEFDFADDIIASDIKFNVSGASGLIPPKEEIDLTKPIKISGFDSNTLYPTVILSVENYPSNTSVAFPVQTQSFDGKYVWTGKSCKYSEINNPDKHNDLIFAINVEEAPDNSDYSYYVYFDKTDPVANGRADIRIMPLIDPSIGEPPITDEFIKFKNPGIYEKGNEAYELNSTKWNASPIKPSEWRIKKDSSVLEHDYIKTIVETKAILNILAETETSFRFIEQEINGQILPTIVYRNLGIGNNSNMVNGFLRINSEPREDYQEKDIFTFCLEKVNE